MESIRTDSLHWFEVRGIGQQPFRWCRASRAMLPELSQLHVKVAGSHNLSTEVLEYEYFRNPVAGGGIYALLNHEDRVCATIGFIPYLLRLGGSIRNTYTAERMLCVPELRGTGVFPRFSNHVLESLSLVDGDPPLIWARTGVPRALYSAGMRSVDCWRRAKRAVRSGSAMTLAVNFELTTKEFSKLALQLCQMRAETGYLDFSPGMLDWSVAENPFVKRTLGALNSGSQTVAVFVSSFVDPETVVVDELLVIPDLNPLTVFRSLEKALSLLGASTLLTGLNALERGHANTMRLLESDGYSVAPSSSCLIVNRPSPEELLSTWHFSGLWAPPYWAANDKPST